MQRGEDEVAAVVALHERFTKARVTLVRTHWPLWQVPFGLSMFWTWALLKAVAARLRGRPQPHGSLFSMRKDWLAGYPPLA